MATINGTNGADSLTGTPVNDTINALAGNDTITVSGGTDTIYGGTGNDTLLYKGGSFTFYGEQGLDTVDFHLATAGVSLTAPTDAAGAEAWIGSDYADVFTLTDAMLGDWYNGFVLSPGAGNDTVHGSAYNDTLIGGTGNDSLVGGAGDDTFVWNIGDGNDVFDGSGDGNDTLVFGAGIVASDLRIVIDHDDLAIYYTPTGAELVLAQEGVSPDHVIETLAFADGSTIDLTVPYNLTGSSGPETIFGGAFNDTIVGFGGDDSIVAQTGSDLLYGSGGNDTINGMSGMDTLYGGNGDDALYGGDSNDWLTGGAGNDIIDGGEGAGDWVSYKGETEGVLIDLTAQYAKGNASGQDLMSGIENAWGSDAADTITGSVDTNLLKGAGGDDHIIGLAGSDTLTGGDGNDWLDGGLGSDGLIGDDPYSPGQTASGIATVNGAPIAISLTGARADPDGTTSVYGYIGNHVVTSPDINVVYVIDVSGSMSSPFGGVEIGDLNGDGVSNTLMDGAILSFTALTNSLIAAGLSDLVNITLVPFDNTSSILFSGQIGQDSDADGVPDAIQNLRTLVPGGATFFDLGLGNAITAFQNAPDGSNYVFFTSDGDPNGGPYQDEVQTLLNTYHATIRTIGLGAGASLPALDYVDDGIYNNSAERVTNPAELTAGLTAATVDIAQIARVDIALNGTVVKSLIASDLVITPVGLQFNTALDGLSVTADDVVTATIVTTGASPVNITAKLTITQSETSTGGADTLLGGLGDDRLDGTGGNDLLYGGFGNDSLVGGTGDDTLDGGSGNDSADYSKQFNSVSVNLGTGVATGVSIGTDTLINIERAAGGYGDDTLTGGIFRAPGQPIYKTDANHIATTQTAMALAGNFTLVDNPNIVNSTTVPHATVVAIGGKAPDYYTFTATVGAIITLDIDATENIDSYLELYNSSGTKVAFNDDTLADPGSTTGHDSFITYTADRSGTWYVKVMPYGGTDVDITQIYTLNVSVTGAATTTQPVMLPDQLSGGTGNDLLVSGRGDDAMNGGSGTDTASFSGATGAVAVDLAGHYAQGDGNDGLSGIENVIGSGFADYVAGDDGANGITGGGGNDTIDGAAGIDTAVFSGNRAQYTIANGAAGVLVVTDTRAGSADGSDQLTNVELLKFADQTIHADIAVAGDIGGDFFSDILLRQASGALTAWQMTGATTKSAANIGNPGGGAALAATGDFNGDGKIDLLFRAANGTLSDALLSGASVIGGGTIANPGSAWALAGTGDFNGDRKSDLVFHNALDGSYAIWNIDGTAVTGGGSIGNPGAVWSFAAAGDFNADGKADILFEKADGSYAVWFMNNTAVIGGGSLPNPGPEWFFKGLGDFNGDGRADILFENASGSYATWDMSGTDVIGGGTIGTPGAQWSLAGIGDYNADDKSDLLFRDASGTLATWTLNDTVVSGGGTIANPGSAFSVAHGVGPAHIADLVFAKSDGTVSGWQVNGASMVGSGTLGVAGAGWTAKAVGDFNGTGGTDVLFQNASGLLAVWQSDGTHVVGGGNIGTPGAGWTYTTTGDFNGDGKTDILFQNGSGVLATWDIGGTTVIGGGTIGNAGAFSVVGTGDLNGDGKSDLIFRDASGKFAAWLMNDTAVIGGGDIGTPGAGWTFKAAADINGDGKADLIFQNASGQIANWDMDGIGVIGGGTIGNPGGTWALSHVADLNADGKADLVFTDAGGQVATWLMNDSTVIGGGTIGTAASGWHLL